MTFIILVLITLFSASAASLVQNNFGKINILNVNIIVDTESTVNGKIYVPNYASSTNQLPGVLLLHGWNNDKDTEGPLALELARRGFIALALSQIGHGYSTPGQTLLATQTTLGANAAFNYLQDLTFVDGTNCGIVGHSMGSSTGLVVALQNQDHKAYVAQSGLPIDLSSVESGNLTVHNYLHLWPQFEEFVPLDRQTFLETGLETIAQNVGTTAALDTTFGNFSTGTAQKYVLIPATHPGGTWNNKGIAETCDWMLEALKGGAVDKNWIPSNQQIYYGKEWLTLFALGASLLSILPLASILLQTSYFKEVNQPIPQGNEKSRRNWWKLASINTLIGGITFVFLPAFGLLFGWGIPLFNLESGNGFTFWLFINAIINAAVFFYGYRKAKARGEGDLYQLGLTFKGEEKSTFALNIIGKTFILAAILLGYLYLFVISMQLVFDVQFRYMWAVFKLINGPRIIMFLLYLVPIGLFFLFNGGIFLFGQIKQPKQESFGKTTIIWWVKNVYALEVGLIVFFFIQYLPMFIFGAAPGFSFLNLIGIPQLYSGSTVYFIFLMQFIPLFVAIIFIMTYCYRKTGKIYLGTILATLLTTWILAVSGAIN